MNASFYTARQGVMSQQEKMNVVSNNIANVNTTGYKSKDSVFQDLMYHNMRDVETVDSRIYAGAGAAVNHTNTNYASGAIAPSTGSYDFGIQGEGFFMIQDSATEEILYTRDGSFQVSERPDGFYLITANNQLVLDRNGQPIRRTETMELTGTPGVFTFENTDGMLSIGNNSFQPIEKNGEPIFNEEAKVLEGYLEQSNVDLANEMTKVIEASRSYSYVLKMLQTSNEVEETINSLRR